MASYWAQQPNGLYCRWSTCVDALTDWNRSEEQAINMCLGYLFNGPNTPPSSQKILDERRDRFISMLKPFSKIKEDFYPCTHSLEEFLEILEEIGDTTGLSEEKLREAKEMERELEELDKEDDEEQGNID